ncbi:nucleoside kinase [Peptostreptococcus faecalis]|uniref:nucleoside kinase n=1 Tax=Peptostreptococcus faecalis TaxID=2045015 RepID=UPI000C79BE61|nr:nucleoside kinase [Peptostreptococcus faecalis]
MSGLKFIVDGKNIEIDKQSVKLSEIAKIVEDRYPGQICSGIINNRLYDLNHTLYDNETIAFVDTTNEDGNRVYFRGLSLMLAMACKELFNRKVYVKHSISGGLYCVFKETRTLKEEEINAIRNKMLEYVRKDYEIETIYMPTDEAIDMFEKSKRLDKANLLKYRKEDVIKVYCCNGYYDCFYGNMFPSTGYMSDLDVEKMADGMVIMGAKNGLKGNISEFKEMQKLSDVYRESEQWSRTLGIDSVVDLNRIIEKNEYGEMIRTVEALHEKKIAEIADTIVKSGSKVILIAAPSSSGKTSFAHRLSIQLKVNGLKPLPISIDNYFLNREFTPIDQDGEHDFESIEAVDIKQFNRDINDLIQGKEINKIEFDFLTGKRVVTDEKIYLGKNQPIILEGIHGLNPSLTEFIDDELKFKIYISVITQINLDDHNRIPTTDLRLIRRMVRDYNFRGYSAEKTIEKWPSVRRGENKNIFPYQEQADVMFNSASVFELSVLKTQAKKILGEINENSNYQIEANRLRELLQYFYEIEDLGDIGPTSIIREFIGGSRIL